MRTPVAICPRWLRPLALVTCSFFSLFLGNICHAESVARKEAGLTDDFSGLKRLKVDADFQVRGWQLADDFYIGQTKIAGKWGVGLLVDRGNYAYGFNNEQVSFLKRF
jgi:hypothetical protein